jgi:hypothetical protein
MITIQDLVGEIKTFLQGKKGISGVYRETFVAPRTETIGNAANAHAKHGSVPCRELCLDITGKICGCIAIGDKDNVSFLKVFVGGDHIKGGLHGLIKRRTATAKERHSV